MNITLHHTQITTLIVPSGFALQISYLKKGPFTILNLLTEASPSLNDRALRTVLGHVAHLQGLVKPAIAAV